MRGRGGPLDGRRDRSRPGRPRRTSSPDGGRRGCRSVAPRSLAVPPWTTRSSPSTSTRAPSAVRPAAMPAMRSDSLWRSSPAPRIVVVPRARAAARHSTGISSIAEATSAGARSIGSRGPRSARRGRRSVRRRRGPPWSDDGRSSISAPIARSRSMTARRVGLTPTSRSDELGIGMDGARDEPEGRCRDVGRHVLIDRLHRRPSFHRPGDAAIVADLALTATPRALSIRSVWSRVATRSRTVVRPSARRPASRIADLTCADGTGVA